MLQAYKRNTKCIVTLIAAGCMVLGVGCFPFERTKWRSPLLSVPDATILSQQCSVRSGSIALAKAEIAYVLAIEAMAKEDPRCVDEFFNAAQHAWGVVEEAARENLDLHGRATEIYHSSLTAVVSEGTKFCRLDARRGLRIHTPNGWSFVPIIHHGFPRSAEDFDELEVVGEYSVPQLNNIYRREGVGVPVVVVRNREQSDSFQRKRQAFAATIVLRHNAGSDLSEQSTVLELHDPLRINSFESTGHSIPMAADTSAPMARALSNGKRSYIQSFLQPGLVKPDEEGLFMLEPYQPGKIPVIFIHGLLSDRLTWANMVNELSARPEFVDRFQFWGFEYPTGEPFLRSAQLLRNQLELIRDRFDPSQSDNALNHIVLVGHSMGGLISKLQVSDSGEQIWDSISNRSFEEVAMVPKIQKQLTEAVFFSPSKSVTRVVFIGTPHKGSALAQRAVGRIGSLLVKQPPSVAEEHSRLINENPCTFSREFSQRFPTSIDLLEPESELLQAIDRLPISPDVRIHSIVGRGNWMIGNGDSDGVVPVSSALHRQSTSSYLVRGKHAKLTENQDVIEEVMRILNEHIQEFVTSTN